MFVISSSFALRALFVIGLLWLGSCLSADAQSFRAHALLGLNAAQIDGDQLWGYNQAGILGGVKVALPLSDNFSVQAGMLYSAKGSRNSETEPFAVWRFTYLELPVEIQARLVDRVYLFGGLSTNYLIRAQVEDAFSAIGTGREGLRDFDLCFTAGIVYRFIDNLGVMARASDGLRSAGEFQYLRNRSFGFALVYYFDAG